MRTARPILEPTEWIMRTQQWLRFRPRLVVALVVAAMHAGTRDTPGSRRTKAREGEGKDAAKTEADPTAASAEPDGRSATWSSAGSRTRACSRRSAPSPATSSSRPRRRRQAYDDESIPIGEGQTITPPYDVAFMTEVLDPKPTDKVYEVGTGSGYQAAILSRLVKDVYSVEIHEPLGKRATEVLKELGYTNIHTRCGDGYAGWPEAAPFDAIIVTCAPESIPQPLVDQLKEGGRMVIPLGDRFNQIVHLIDQEGRQADRQAAQADPVRADDRQGPAGGRREAQGEHQGERGKAVRRGP